MNQLIKTLALAGALAALVSLPAQAKHKILDKLGAVTVTIDGQPPREGSGAATTLSRKIAGFSRIELRSAERLRVTPGKGLSLRLTGDDNLLELIATEVRGDTLIIEARGSYRTKKAITIDIVMPALSALTLAGSGDAAIEALDPKGFKLDIDGSGAVQALGLVDQLDIEVNGSGDADLSGVEAKAVEAEVNGSGNISIGVTPSLKAEINGSGDIVYQGEPKTLKTEINGSGSIRRR